MMDRDVVSSIGLSLDIAGVVLLFFFGIPSRAALDGVLTWGRGGGRDYKGARIFSGLALVLLIVGFALQIASNHLPAAPHPGGMDNYLTSASASIFSECWMHH